MIKGNTPSFCLRDASFPFTHKLNEAKAELRFIYNKLGGEILFCFGTFYPLFCINETKPSSCQKRVWTKPSVKRHACFPASQQTLQTQESQEEREWALGLPALNKGIGTFLKSDDCGKCNYQTGCVECILLSLLTNLMESSFPASPCLQLT